MKQKLIITIIALVIIVGTIVWYTSSHKAVAPETAPGTSQNSGSNDEVTGDVPGDSPENNPTIPTSATIAASTQVPGDSVTIDNAFLEKPGFISIHEVTSTGQAGVVIGSSNYLSVGPKQDLEVKAPIKAGAKYIAMLRTDNGDKKFNAATDEPVLNNNIVLMTMFSVSQ